MTLEQFIEGFVQIAPVAEANGLYGLYPYHIWAENDAKEATVAALIGLKIKEIFAAARKIWHEKDMQCLYLAVDFPPNPEIKQDFVAVFSLSREGEIDNAGITIIRYDTKTGLQFDPHLGFETDTGTALLNAFLKFTS